MYRHPTFKTDYGEFTWCSVCQRVSLTEIWVEKAWCCPGEACGGQPFNAWDWATIRLIHPDYPKRPDAHTPFQVVHNK